VSKPKILTIDIETLPAVSFHWRMFDENISVDQLIEPSRIYSVGAKWLGQKKPIYLEAPQYATENGMQGDPAERETMLLATRDLILAADAIVTFNGDSFDLPRLNGEFAAFGIKPVPAPTSIDLIKTVRKFKLMSNKLAYVLQHFGLGAKVDTGGFKLWREVYCGDKKARSLMRTYCIGDVIGEEDLYKFLKPYMRNHPYLGDKPSCCPNCGGENLQSRGSRRTRKFKVQRLQCQDCGAWSEGARESIK